MIQEQPLDKVPDGIPPFTPTRWLALASIFGSKKLVVLAYKAPFKTEDLAWHAARSQVLADYRKQVGNAFFIAIQLTLFLLSNSHEASLGTFREWLDPFAHLPDNLLWWKAWVDLGLTVFVAGFLLLLAMASTFTQPLRDALKEFWEESRERLFGIESHRTLLFFGAQIVSIMTFFWLLQMIGGLEFKLTADPSRARSLSGFEFLYYFFATYTTAGLGDIVPISKGAQLMTIAINVLTLLSIIYWFNAVARGPRSRMLRKHIGTFYREHLARIEKLVVWADKAKVDAPGRTFHGHVICPAGHAMRPGTAKGCRCCRGLRTVSPDVAVAYAAWPPMRLIAFLSAINGKVGSSRVDLQACKLEYSIVSPK